MLGEQLHSYDQRLCDYLISNVRQFLNRPSYARWLEQTLSPPALRRYVIDEGARDAERLLHDDELERFESLFTDGPPDDGVYPWVPDVDLHQRSVLCVSEIRQHLTAQDAEKWAQACDRFARQLEGPDVFLRDGIDVVRTWIEHVRLLLRAMGATCHLPYPDGDFPTPTCPTPPCPPQPAEAQAARPAQQDPSNLTVAILETQALQREVRDLLLSQRQVKDFYSTAEVANTLGRAEYTVREWCRQGRIRAKKKPCGRGKGGEWLISHDELTRVANEGLLPFGHTA